jgi:hypothetical protein
LLLIAGTGRNSGKTTMVCRIISKFKHTVPLIALKISPHQHNPETRQENNHSGKTYFLQEETDPATGKDSSKMLAAGAGKSYFISSADEQLEQVMQQIITISGESAFYIAESGGLRNWVKPGLFFILNGIEQRDFKPGITELMKKEHTWITFDGREFDFDINRIDICNERWVIV